MTSTPVIKIRYKDFDQFYRLNTEKFRAVQAATKTLKSPEELGMSGQALLEAEKLAYHYLNLKSTVNDLLFGLSASVLDAKADIKTQFGIVFREIAGGVKEREYVVQADPRVINANKTYNDLNDLKEYLMGKLNDFESAHYYYKQMTKRD